MDNDSLLLTAIFLPLLGAVLMWVVAPLGRDAVRWSALAVAILTLLAAGTVVCGFPDNVGTPGTDVAWGTGVLSGIHFSVGLDGLGLWMFGLSALLLFTSVLVSWEAIRDREPLFYAMLLLLGCGSLGVFSARDIILFYVFFEFTLIPLFFLIGIWGSEQRRHAAVKFFLFTLAGSVLTFLGLLAIVLYVGPADGRLVFSISDLTAALAERPIEPYGLQLAIFLALFAGFAIKVPLFPLHTWLPLAHVQAPTAGSVFLAGILLKIGTYGFLRFSLPMLPEATAACMPCILWLAVAGIVYGAFVALAQSDMKRLIAYSSVSHLGFVMLGIFALNPLGVQGGTLQMINHGISTGALFALIGMIYERYHTREISRLGGLARKMPRMAFFMLVFTFSSIGLPGLNGFVGEFMILIGMFQRAWVDPPQHLAGQWLLIAVFAVSGVVLGAWYMLWLVQRVFFGPLREDVEHHADDPPVADLNPREMLALTPLAIFVVWIGIQPDVFLSRMAPSLEPLAAQAASNLPGAVDRPAVSASEREDDTRVR